MEEAKEYTAIRVATLRGDMPIPFDVFIKVAGKQILYCRSGSSFEGVRLARLRAKRLRKMFVRKQDEIPYRQYLEANIDNAYKNKGQMSIRAEVIQGFQQAVTEDYLDDPLDAFTYNHMRSSVQRFTEFLQREPEGIKRLLEIPNVDQSISHHGVAVGTLAVAMAMEDNIRDGLQLSLFAMGCFLHDLEHFHLNFNPVRPLSELSKPELAVYKEHPLKGAHRLQGVTFMDQIVTNVITQHEEKMDGSGFPKGLYEKQMDPLILIAGLANFFDRFVSFEGMTAKEALKETSIKGLGLYPLSQIQNLQKILKRLQLI